MSAIIVPKELTLHYLYRMVKRRAGEEVGADHEDIPRFRFAYFNLRFLFHLASLCLIGYGAMRLLGTEDIIATNIYPNLWKLAAVIVVGMLVMCYGEFLLHLYPMHKGIRLRNASGKLGRFFDKWMASIKRSHDALHHGSTKVALVKGEIRSKHPIMTPEQTVSATFPTLALFGFWGLFITPVIALQLLLPSYPVFLGAAIAISWAMWLYENIHAVHHFPEDWWRKQCKRPVIGPVMLYVYMHHFVHHLNTRRNLNVGGFMLVLPLADMTLGTFVNLSELMKAWLNNDPTIDLIPVIDRALTRLKREPWSFRIRSTLFKST